MNKRQYWIKKGGRRSIIYEGAANRLNWRTQRKGREPDR